MKTKLEIKFNTLFTAHKAKQELLSKEYEKSLLKFIKDEIIGENSFEKHLDDNYRDAYEYLCDHHAEELVEIYVKPTDVMEQIISSQIYLLMNHEDFLDIDGALYKTALDNEGIRL